MTSERVRKGTTRLGLIYIDYLLAIMVRNVTSSILIPVGTEGQIDVRISTDIRIRPAS